MNPFHHIQFVFFDNSFVYHLCQETSPWIFHLPFRQRGLVWKKVKKCCSGEARLCRKQLQVIRALRACVWLNDKLMFSEREGLFGSRCFQVRLGKKVEEKDKAPVGLVWKHLHVELIQNIFLLIQLKSTINTLQQMLLNVPKYSWL